MGDAAKLIEKLASKHPDAAKLAKFVSLAVRIEPGLLRKARLELLPDADASSEADLWFSDLVESRNIAAIVFRQNVSDCLRKQLAEKQQELDTVWHLIESVHQYTSPAIRAEEKLAWLALSGREQPMKELLRSVLSTMILPHRSGLTEWASRAFPRLPEGIRKSEEGQMLAFGLSLRIEEPDGYDIPRNADDLSKWASWLTPTDLPTARFGVRLVQGAVEFGPPGRLEEHLLDLPKTTPILIELNWHQNQTIRSKRVRLIPGEVTTIGIAPRIYFSQYLNVKLASDDQFLSDMQQFFGDDNITMKSDNQEPGPDITITIETTMRSCQVMLVLINPNLFDPADSESSTQILDDMDFFRMEYRTGLRLGLEIIPVLLNGASMPQDGYLPEELTSLTSLKAFAYETDSGKGLDALIAVLQGQVELKTVLGQHYLLSPSLAFNRKERFMPPNWLPRVRIEYDVELYGAEKKVELPFVMGVLAGLSGKAKSDDSAVPVDDRRFLEIDVHNFNDRLKTMKPHVAFDVPNVLFGEGQLKVDLTFDSLADFSPVAVARKVYGVKELLEERARLDNLLTYMDGNSGAEALMGKLINDESLLQALTSARKHAAKTINPSPADEKSNFAALLQKEFKPISGEAQEQVRNAVRTLAEFLIENVDLARTDAVSTIEDIKVKMDGKLTAQINPILHHEEFQELESAWRGLHYLVHNTDSDELLKIKVLNISKVELSNILNKFKGSRWDISPLFKRIYEEEFSSFGGQPYGCLVGDYYFDHSPPDVALLGEIAKIAASAHAPFIAAASPSVMQMDSWAELSAPADLAKKFSDADYASWESLRESDDARFIGLAMPRFLARLPYGSKTEPVEAFDFEEEVEGADTSKYVWANSVYAMAANINRAFKLYGWCSRIRGKESGGVVEGLPVHTFPTDDGGVDMKCPTEIGIGDRREAELSKLGFMPLIHVKNSDFAVFSGAQSLQKPAIYDDPDATANANLATRLPYIFACCRFAHYLKCIVRDKIGSFKERDDMQEWLQKWIMQYVDGDPAHSSETIKAKKPLAAAAVDVEEVEGNPGFYTSYFFLQPHYQLEGLTVSLRLVSKLPSVKG